jgi:hypothetical protein
MMALASIRITATYKCTLVRSNRPLPLGATQRARLGTCLSTRTCLIYAVGHVLLVPVTRTRLLTTHASHNQPIPTRTKIVTLDGFGAESYPPHWQLATNS